MPDFVLFIAGSLFTTDYLVEAITSTSAYLDVDVFALRTKLDAVASAFPQNSKTNECQTEDDFIWPVFATLGWTESLRQQNLGAKGRDDVPDGLLFENTGAKVLANSLDDQSKR